MTTAIDYAPPLPWHRRRKVRRAAIWFAALLLLVLAACYFAPPTCRRARILYWQHRCMTHAEPPGTRVVEASIDPASGFETRFNSRCADSQGFNRALAGRAAVALPGGNVVFLHSRRCAAGERLVSVQYALVTLATRPLAGVVAPDIVIIDPGSLTQDPKSISLPFRFHLLSHVSTGDTFRAYAGQIDPADDAAFAIDFDVNTVRHTARFRLNPTGDGIDMVSVTPPI
jgi:hypothetical protein